MIYKKKTFLAKRHSELDPTEMGLPDGDRTTNLLYLDANNLYSVAQALPMPFGEYRWVESEEYDAIDWEEIGKLEDRDEGFFLEVSLSYPESLHTGDVKIIK